MVFTHNNYSFLQGDEQNTLTPLVSPHTTIHATMDKDKCPPGVCCFKRVRKGRPGWHIPNVTSGTAGVLASR